MKSYFSCFTSNPKKVSNTEQKCPEKRSGCVDNPRNSLTTSSSGSASASCMSSSADSSSSASASQYSTQVALEEEFVFAARPLNDALVDPRFVILFICAAEGIHHSDTHMYRQRDPQLSEKGLKQARVVRRQLRKAQQAQPSLMLCSSLYRCLSTAQLVCGEWYGSVPLVALDELRPPVGTYTTNQRSSIATLAQDFTHATFKFTKGVLDQFWSDEEETDEMFCNRLHEFVYSRLYNLSERRLVIVSHRCVFNALFQHVVESSTELQACWKHCDLRKVFVYKRKDLATCSNFVSTRPPELGTIHSISTQTYIQREDSQSDETMIEQPHPAGRHSASMGVVPGGLIPDTIHEGEDDVDDDGDETPSRSKSGRLGLFRKNARR